MTDVTKTFKMGLCEGRHEIPYVTDGYIFGFEVDPLRPALLELQAGALMIKNDIKKLDLYVTGLSVALVAVINAARVTGVDLTLYHYDKDTNIYYPQEVM